MADERIDEGFFSARDGIRLFWHTERAAAPAGHVAVVHGYAEHLGRHSEVMRALAAAGYTAHLLDCRGHGQSGESGRTSIRSRSISPTWICSSPG